MTLLLLLAACTRDPGKDTLADPPDETAGEGTPVEEQPVDEEPVEELPVEEPIDEEPIDEEPIDEEPVDEPDDGCGPDWVGDLDNASLPELCAGYVCRKVDGDVYLTGEDLTDLSALACLTEVTGRMTLHDTGISSLAGLEQLAVVGDDLRVSANHALVDFTGLDRLTTVGDWLYVFNNQAIVDLHGLESLRSVAMLNVRQEYAVTSLAGLDGLQDLGGLYIAEMPALLDLDGLGVPPTRCIDLAYLAALTDLGALSGATTLTEHLSIGYTDSLQSLAGLENLRTLGGNLFLKDNRVLTDVTALHGVEDVGGSIAVFHNESLPEADAIALLDAVDHVDGGRVQSRNGP